MEKCLRSVLASGDRWTWWACTATLYTSRLAVRSLPDGRTPGSLEPLLKIHHSILFPQKENKISREESQINSSASWNLTTIDKLPIFSCPKFYILSDRHFQFQYSTLDTLVLVCIKSVIYRDCYLWCILLVKKLIYLILPRSQHIKIITGQKYGLFMGWLFLLSECDLFYPTHAQRISTCHFWGIYRDLTTIILELNLHKRLIETYFVYFYPIWDLDIDLYF